jgi:hypothetical protein
MSKKASNLCFRHLNHKHKLRRRIRPQDTRTDDSTSLRPPRAARRRSAAPDSLFPETVQGIRNSFGDPEMHGLTRRSKQMALTMLNGFQSERSRFGVF